MPPRTVIILTHKCKQTGDVKLPHFHCLRRTNPDVSIEVVVGPDAPPELGPGYNWKNGDQSLRAWWKERRHSIPADELVVIEWDTLVATQLPRLPDDLDLAGKTHIQLPTPWRWWPDARHMDLKPDEQPIGLVSFGAFFMRRWVLDAVCKPRWDACYRRSIQNELRFPTAANIEGARVGTIPLPFVEWHETKLTTTPGIYHAVKNKLRDDKHFVLAPEKDEPELPTLRDGVKEDGAADSNDYQSNRPTTVDGEHIASHNRKSYSKRSSGVGISTDSASRFSKYLSGDAIRLYQWNKLYNFGDQISQEIVQWISGRTVELVCQSHDKKLLAVGSVLHFSRDGDIVWGTGIHPNPQVQTDQRAAMQLDVRAVRGPLTREFMLRRGINCPERYGDPGILLPLVHPQPVKPCREYGVIPHIFEQDLFTGIDYIDVKKDWREVVASIVQCAKIISSSLHGIIIAEAYGVPAVWLRVTEREGTLKYHDYYLGTGREAQPVTTLTEAIRSPGNPLPDFNRDILLESFPKELMA